jgi:hypothetical protein
MSTTVEIYLRTRPADEASLKTYTGKLEDLGPLQPLIHDILSQPASALALAVNDGQEPAAKKPKLDDIGTVSSLGDFLDGGDELSSDV